MRPQDAAQRFVGLVLHATFDDVLDLTDPLDVDHQARVRTRKRAYAEVESVVRQRLGVADDLDALQQAVRIAASDNRRIAVAIAVTKLIDAVTDELTVKQQTGYVVGLAVGRALRASVSGEVGGGWRSPMP